MTNDGQVWCQLCSVELAYRDVDSVKQHLLTQRHHNSTHIADLKKQIQVGKARQLHVDRKCEMYHRVQIRLLTKLDKKSDYITERVSGAEPGMINTATKMEPVPETAAKVDDRDTLFDDIHSMAAETEHGQEHEVAPG